MSLVGIRREGQVCVLTLQREEKLNALSGAMERELLDSLSGDDVRGSHCLVLTGAGKAFSAGADINEFADADAASIAAYYADTGDVYERIAALPMPTIAAIHGWCLGGGLELALATDFRIADETAAFGLPEVELGILRAPAGPTGSSGWSAREGEGADAPAPPVRRGRGAHRWASSPRSPRRAMRSSERSSTAESSLRLPPLAVETIKRAADLIPEASREAAMLIERLGYAALTDRRRRPSTTLDKRPRGEQSAVAEGAHTSRPPSMTTVVPVT